MSEEYEEIIKRRRQERDDAAAKRESELAAKREEQRAFDVAYIQWRNDVKAALENEVKKVATAHPEMQLSSRDDHDVWRLRKDEAPRGNAVVKFEPTERRILVELSFRVEDFHIWVEDGALLIVGPGRALTKMNPAEFAKWLMTGILLAYA